MSTETHDHHGEGAGHPTPKTYLIIAVILSVVTYLEYYLFGVKSMQAYLIPVLSVLSIFKFALVVMFYMHLKFDHPVFSRMLVLGIILAFAIFLALLALFNYAHPVIRPLIY